MKENILIVGGGGREHAIGWKIKQHFPDERRLFFAPGNGGTEQLGQNIDIDANDIDRLVGFASDHDISFTVVGPEGPLAQGIVNAFSKEQLSIFGHTQEAAILESDKAEAALFMRRYNIPHPEFAIFNDPPAAEAFVKNAPWSDIVIKASGLAEGKGVVLPDSEDEAVKTIRRMMYDREFGNAGEKIVIQERLKGNEVSAIGFVANEIGLFVPARDYKRLLDGDRGPNTGGMGAYAPNTNLTTEQLQEIYHTILIPTVTGMRQEGRPMSGILYAGIMLTEDGPKVIEYNVRFGDPETQVQMRLLQSDLLEGMKATLNGTLNSKHYQSRKDAAVGVVLASTGYPGNSSLGKEVRGADPVSSDEVIVFHGGTKKEGRKLVSSGGRVLTITATGKTKEEATEKVYNVINKGEISLDGQVYRTDIAR